MTPNEKNLVELVGGLVDPNTGKPLASAQAVKSARLEGTRAEVEIELAYPAASRHASMKAEIEAALLAQPGISEARVELKTRILPHAVQNNLPRIEGVRNIIAVASGKGGVGKSTTAVNIALALAKEGAHVGILDADIYGPSQPQMLGIADQRPESADGKTMLPLKAHDIQANSIGFLVDEEQPMIWRGPMATQALKQLAFETRWNDLDYLIVDMPPGTGDVQLTLAQAVPVTGAVIVTTPQDIALLDARRGLKMFEKVGIPLLGLVENMSIHVCSNCGHAEHIFGAGGGEAMCADYDLPFLGSLALDIKIRTQTDSGRPSVIAEPEGPIAEAYRDIAIRLGLAIAERPRDRRILIPTVVISKEGKQPETNSKN